MASGTVKWFNATKGYGLSSPTPGARTCSSISRRSKRQVCRLPEGAKVSYDVVPNKGKELAENLKMK